jgi:AbiEi antitoxin C-terminal domain
MQRNHSQFGRRKNAASPRRLALRLVMHDLSKDFVQRLAVSPNDSSELSEVACPSGTQRRLPTASPNTTVGEVALDATALRSLHEMFQLLDEWDRAIAMNSSSAKKSSDKCEISVDRKTY